MRSENPVTIEEGIKFEALITPGGQPIEKALVITTNPYIDERGHFVKTYDSKIFAKLGLPTEWPEGYEGYNHETFTVRGFHFQHKNAQTKLVRVNTGSALFVVLDLRQGSKTFGEWGQTVISAKDNTMIISPKGCALCMCTLEPETRLLYQMDDNFVSDSYDGIVWNSPELKIPWPVQIPTKISPKDATAQSFTQFREKYGSLADK